MTRDHLRGVLLLVAVLLHTGSNSKQVCVRTANWGDVLSHLRYGTQMRDNAAAFVIKTFSACEKLGHTVVMEGLGEKFYWTNIPDVLIFIDAVPFLMPKLPGNYEVPTRILFAWEPPSTNSVGWPPSVWYQRFDGVYTLCDDLVDNLGTFKVYEPQPSFDVLEQLPLFSARKLVTILTGRSVSQHPRELYSRRSELIYNFAGTQDGIDVWGLRGRRGSSWGGGTREFAPSGVCRGFASSKLECYKNYKFAICYENMRGRPGYITSEKFMFCFLAGCIPVYWGADNISDYVSPDCFIDRRNFESDGDLYSYLGNFTEDDYAKFLENIRRYMKSPWPHVFSHNNFVDLFISSFDPDYNRSTVFTEEELAELRLSKLVMWQLGHLTEADAKRWGVS